MNYIATFDVGTTAVKGVLVSDSGEVILSHSETIETIYEGDFIEQKPEDWFSAFCKIAKIFCREKSAAEISAVILSGQMQDLIMISQDGSATMNAILYSDVRASDQAKRILAKIGEDVIFSSTANRFDGSMPFAKLLWVKENLPDVFEKTQKILISSKDYILYQLTGAAVSDVVASSTAGLMDIRKKQWNTQWLDAFNLASGLLPRLCSPEEKIGTILDSAAAQCGFASDTPVYAGSGDAGATTLASGISQNGEFNINLGTSGWIACVSDQPMMKKTVFNLAAIPHHVYVNVVPFFNAGNVHHWICSVLTEDGKQDEMFSYGSRLLKESNPGSDNLLFLPYLVGERFPVVDSEIRGAYIGITPETTKQDLIRAALEGVAFSIRQGLATIGKEPKTISIVGGGAQESVWCQILADMLNHEVMIFPNSEYLPAIALSASVLLDQKKISDYRYFTDILNKKKLSQYFYPDAAAAAIYDRVYERYLRIYTAIKQI
ncbi:MAG: sugar kinase [Flexilinea flocculi]|nr:sugar kinase [Flexilinea flocculi]